jgi:hypothetical protein
MDAAHGLTLEARRIGLDRKIAEESRRPMPDSQVIAALKKQKLKLKDAIFFR